MSGSFFLFLLNTKVKILSLLKEWEEPVEAENKRTD